MSVSNHSFIPHANGLQILITQTRKTKSKGQSTVGRALALYVAGRPLILAAPDGLPSTTLSTARYSTKNPKRTKSRLTDNEILREGKETTDQKRSQICELCEGKDYSLQGTDNQTGRGWQGGGSFR